MSPLRRSSDPILGWRLWRVRDQRLQSWAINHFWEPGQNAATCHDSERSCPAPPGRHCQCGFWALWSPLRCLSMASSPIEPPWYAVGLVAAWGEVAVHGREGFRAQHASVTCLFSDWAGAAPVPDASTGRITRWAHGVLGRPFTGRRCWRPDPDPTRVDSLRHVAARYAVPLITMRGAVESRLLGEWGVPVERIREVEAWLASVALHGRVPSETGDG